MSSQFGISVGAVNNIVKRKREYENMKTFVNLLGEHPCIVNMLLGPVNVHYREVLLYISCIISSWNIL